MAPSRPCWLRRAVRNRHLHAVEQVPRRWRGGHDPAVVETRPEDLIYAQMETVMVVDVELRLLEPGRSFAAEVRRLRGVVLAGGGCASGVNKGAV